MIILTLPTGHYILGAAAVVALTALLVVLAPRLPTFRPAASRASRRRRATSAAGCGFARPRRPRRHRLLRHRATPWATSSPSPSGRWSGSASPSPPCSLGDLWRPIEPWSGPVVLTRRLLGRTAASASPASATGPRSPASSPSPGSRSSRSPPTTRRARPRRRASTGSSIFVLAVLEGPAWLRRGEAFTVFFRFIAGSPPSGGSPPPAPAELFAGPPGAQILATPPLTPSAAAFVTLVLAAVSFDGLHHTFWWLARLGINPLEFPGRSAVTLPNTLGLLAAWALTAAAILATVALARRLARARTPFWHEAGPAMLALPPHRRRLSRRPLPDAAPRRPPLRPRRPRSPGAAAHGVTLGFLTDTAQRAADLGRPVRHDPRRPRPRRARRPPPRRPPARRSPTCR